MAELLQIYMFCYRQSYLMEYNLDLMCILSVMCNAALCEIINLRDFIAVTKSVIESV